MLPVLSTMLPVPLKFPTLAVVTVKLVNALIYPPLITALAVFNEPKYPVVMFPAVAFNVVAVPVPTLAVIIVALVNALIYPPLITALAVFNESKYAVVMFPAVAFNVVVFVVCAATVVNVPAAGVTAPIGMLLIPLVPVPPRNQTVPVGAANKLVAALKLLTYALAANVAPMLMLSMAPTTNGLIVTVAAPDCGARYTLAVPLIVVALASLLTVKLFNVAAPATDTVDVAVIVVNAPVLGVALPIGVELILPAKTVPAYKLPAIPTPPATVIAPVMVFVAAVAFEIINSPDLTVPYVPLITLLPLSVASE